jgi:pyridoxine 4-dehydrogenase
VTTSSSSRPSETGQFRAAQRITDIAAVTAHYNIGDRTGASLLAAAEADGVAFSPWHPTTVADQAGATPRLADVLGPLRSRHHATTAQLAARYRHGAPTVTPAKPLR